jgi:hypothetical protein
MRSPRAPGLGPFHQKVIRYALLDGPNLVWIPLGEVPWSVVWFLRVPGFCGPLSRGSSLYKWPPYFLIKSGGAIPGVGYLTPVVWLSGESGHVQVVGHNRRPAVSGVQDPDKLKAPKVNGFIDGEATPHQTLVVHGQAEHR